MGKGCGPDKCKMDEKLLENGTCQKCEKYGFIASDDDKSCMSPCGPNEALRADGECNKCPLFYRLSDDGYECM